MFEWIDEKYSNEQEIIAGGTRIIYWYCRNVKCRWIDIEHLMVENGLFGYWYARDVIEGRYEPELETLYLMRHSGSECVELYIRDLVSV